MSPYELAHRLRDKADCEAERFGLYRTPALPGGTDFWEYLETAASRFYPLADRGFVNRHFPDWIERMVEDADELCRHRVELLGFARIDLGSTIDWHRDPVTGKQWERKFWSDYRLEQDPEGRDAKNVHELNRHQHLPRLAKAYRLTGMERYAAEAVHQLESWIDQNPPGMGVNWHSSLEIAIRSISWLWTLFLLLPSRSLHHRAARRISASLFAQLDHVYRHTSLYSSPNTHLIGEAVALFIGGTVFCDQKRPAMWRERGAALLAEQAEIQILNDGVYGELSAYYHCYALDFYLQALILADHNQCPFPERVREKFRRMLDFLMHLTRPDGTIPLLGDDDGGRALALHKRNYREFNEALSIGAVLFQRADFKHQSGGFAEEALWLLGHAAFDTYHRLPSEPPAATGAFYPHAGYFIQRSDWGPLATHLVFDCGGLGMLTGGHAHADALSVVLFSGGREALSDSGTFIYNGEPEWRSYFRSTQAHNTVTIDRADQAEPAGTFRWNGKISARVERAAEYIEAEHDVYARIGVIHRRRLLRLPPDSWIVVDDFRGNGEHTFDFNYHFGADANVSMAQSGPTLVEVRTDADFVLALCASTPVSPQLLEGWVSPGYGEKKPGAVLRARFIGLAPIVMTFLMPMVGKVRQQAVDGGNAVAWSCVHDGYEDIAVFSTADSEIVVADFRMRGEFFCLRVEGRELRNVAAIRALDLRHKGRIVFQRSEPESFFCAIPAKDESLCAQSAVS